MKKIIIIASVFVIIAIILFAIAYFTFFNDTEYIVKITDKERIDYLSKESSESKYLIYCETEEGETIVFENTDNFLRLKFNSSDIYAQLNIGKTYRLTVVGLRIPIFSSYQNIIMAEEIENGQTERN